jgi:hypothetical protein
MTTSETETPLPPLASERIHRRQVRRQIVLPLLGGFLLLVLLMVAVLVPPLLPQPIHVATLSNLLLILFMLLPTFFCLFGFYIILLYAVMGLGIFNRASARQLRRLNRLTETVTDQTVKVTTAVDKQALEARVKLAGVEAAIDRALQPADSEAKLDDTQNTDEDKSNGDNDSKQ